MQWINESFCFSDGIIWPNARGWIPSLFSPRDAQKLAWKSPLRTVTKRQRRIVAGNGYCSSSEIENNACSSRQRTNFVYRPRLLHKAFVSDVMDINSERENRVLLEMQRNHKLPIVSLPSEPARMLWMHVQYFCIVAIVILWRGV